MKAWIALQTVSNFLWAGRQVGSRYVGSEFMGHAAASDVFVHIHSAIKGFQLHKISSTSVHGGTECQLEIPGAISEWTKKKFKCHVVECRQLWSARSEWFRLFREKCSADRSWKFVLVGPEAESHGKVTENDFPKRAVTLNIPSCSWPNHSSDVVKWSLRGTIVCVSSVHYHYDVSSQVSGVAEIISTFHHWYSLFIA